MYWYSYVHINSTPYSQSISYENVKFENWNWLLFQLLYRSTLPFTIAQQILRGRSLSTKYNWLSHKREGNMVLNHGSSQENTRVINSMTTWQRNLNDQWRNECWITCYCMSFGVKSMSSHLKRDSKLKHPTWHVLLGCQFIQRNV